jgi:hypothetical protein
LHGKRARASRDSATRDRARRDREQQNRENADRAKIRTVRTRNAQRKNAIRNRPPAIAVAEVVAGVAVTEVVKREVSAEASVVAAEVEVNVAVEAASAVVDVAMIGAASAAGVDAVVRIRDSDATQSGRAATVMMRPANATRSGRKKELRAKTTIAKSGRAVESRTASAEKTANRAEKYESKSHPNLRISRPKCRWQNHSLRCGSSRRSHRP